MSASEIKAARDAWSDYWQTGSTEQAMPDDNPGTQKLAAFWDCYATELLQRPGGRLLDLACGGGFVSRRMGNVLASQLHQWQLLALDLAEPALRQLVAASPVMLSGVVADAAQLPFASGSIHAVVSQFGLEYAGHAALIGAAALLAPEGELVLLVHHADGSIAHSCRSNAETIGTALDSGLLQGMTRLFSLLAERNADSGPLNTVSAELQQSVLAIETLIKTGPVCTAMPWIQRLYHDVRQLYGRATAYDPAEAIKWLQGMEGQLRSYRERMQGMVSAALSEAQLESVCRGWQDAGLVIHQAQALDVDERPLAWQLRAVRSAA